jgi:hypothetical protein
MRMTQKEYNRRSRMRKKGIDVPDARKWEEHPHTGSEITADLVRSMMHYDPETGDLFWKATGQPNWDGRLAGKAVGGNRRGYICFDFNRKSFRAHRVIWLWMTGEWPKELIDHVDSNGLNNRWSNLREANSKQNAWNRRALRILPKGVHQSDSRYSAKIMVAGRSLYLGIFDTPEEAHAAYMRAALENFGEFARAA